NRFDLTGLPATIHYQEFTSEQFSNELQLNFSTDGLFGTGIGADGIAAFFYFHENSFEDNRTGFTGDPVPPAQASLLTQRVVLLGTGKAESYAAFANTTLHLTDRFGLKLGGRFTHESRAVDNSSLVILANNARVSRALADKKSFSDFTPEVGLEFKPSEDILFYYTYSEGFKTGAGLLGNLDQGISRPETIKNHEIGVKSSFFNRRLIANVAAFSYRLSDLQVGRTVPTNASGTGFAQRFENAATLKGEGIEFEIKARPIPQLRIDAGAAYLNARFGEFQSINQLDPEIILGPIAVPPRAPPIISLRGDRPRQSPKWSFNLHTDADVVSLANGGRVVVAADLSYKGEQFFSEFNAPVFRQASYTLIDAGVTYHSPDDRWSLSLFGKNLANKLVSSGAFAVSLTRTVGQTFLPPRTYGATLGVNF
ncbi:MAG: TonB-dependent receptor, partial [Sphingomonas bacterium]|nr:TonB-dependent receptor [Sphingomonas bacterium]